MKNLYNTGGNISPSVRHIVMVSRSLRCVDTPKKESVEAVSLESASASSEAVRSGTRNTQEIEVIKF